VRSWTGWRATARCGVPAHRPDSAAYATSIGRRCWPAADPTGCTCSIRRGAHRAADRADPADPGRAGRSWSSTPARVRHTSGEARYGVGSVGVAVGTRARRGRRPEPGRPVPGCPAPGPRGRGGPEQAAAELPHSCLTGRTPLRLRRRCPQIRTGPRRTSSALGLGPSDSGTTSFIVHAPGLAERQVVLVLDGRAVRLRRCAGAEDEVAVFTLDGRRGPDDDHPAARREPATSGTSRRRWPRWRSPRRHRRGAAARHPGPRRHCRCSGRRPAGRPSSALSVPRAMARPGSRACWRTAGRGWRAARCLDRHQRTGPAIDLAQRAVRGQPAHSSGDAPPRTAPPGCGPSRWAGVGDLRVAAVHVVPVSAGPRSSRSRPAAVLALAAVPAR